MMKPFFMLPGEPFNFCRDHFHVKVSMEVSVPNVPGRVNDGYFVLKLSCYWHYFSFIRRTLYVRNIEGRSRSHCCRGNTISIKYMSVCLSVCLSVFLPVLSGIPIESFLRCVVFCGMSGTTILFHVLIHGTIRWTTLPNIKMCVLIFSAIFCLKYFSF
jgi:hypothetical protein